ncbi:oxidoreductase [Sphingomonas sp. Leaf412]|uniref:SDR family NAD(P)-dependent oxidoreductase n=1 Tax=Sphingomonas sp. Leaf412 TaxID=1736370 RepID=UPI000701A36B|nr:SDR family NAD(P)-dependent oxidoreductase [Sphingomonas sp. Leaf412]KQT35099.1 oxidoreductase [Sphingomonas sp. Leaf412]
MNDLNGRVALVTGGGRGIGRAIALRLARDGADVAVNYRRDADAAAEVVAQIEGLGRRARAYGCSVDRFEDAAAMVDAIVADFGAVDILVNNAGIASRGQSVADTDPAELDRVIRTHALAPHVLSKLVLPSMRARPRGDIVMISSVATLHHQANGAPYNMGKAAMEALALTLAKEERGNGIRTNIVAPGLTVTDMGERLAKATMGVADIHDLDAKSHFGRVSTPEDVAAAVAYFVSADAEYVNGQKINLNAGG